MDCITALVDGVGVFRSYLSPLCTIAIFNFVILMEQGFSLLHFRFAVGSTSGRSHYQIWKIAAI